MKVHNLTVTGSLTSGGEVITSISSSTVTKLGSLSSSLSTSMGGLSSSMASSMTALSSSLTSSMGSLSSSMVTSMNDLSSSMGSIMATTGSNLFKGNQTISGSIIPAVNGLYDLGSITNEFRDLYLSSASLYIDGTKVLGSTTQELTITTDTGQSFKILEAGSDTITLQAADGNITFATSGGGDVILDPTSGVIALKGTTTLYAGNKILSSDGNAIQIGNSVTMTGSLIVTGFIETQELRTTYISSSILYRSGSTKFGDELTDTHSFTGSLSVSGSISIPESGLVSGSSQITYSGLSGVPSGIISGSAQLPSGLVSGSVQVLNGSGVFSGSAQLPSDIVSSSAQTIANLPSGVVSGSAQTIANLPSGVVSGSSQVLNGTTIHSGSFFNGISVVSGSVQVDVMSTTNIARLATTGSNTFTSNQIISGSVSITGSINVTGSLLTTGSSVGIGGQANPARTLHVMGQGAFDMTHAGVVIQDSISPMTASQIVSYKQTNAVGSAYRNMHLRADVLGVAIMSGSGYVSIGKDSANSMLDVSGNTIISGSLTTTGDINVNSSGIIINRNTSGEPYLFFRKDGVNRGSIYGITGGGLRMFDQSDNQVLTMTGSMIGINKSSPSGTLDVQSSGANGIVLSSDSTDTNNSGRLFFMRTGGEGFAIMNNSGNLSFRSNSIPGNTSGNERMKLDSSYNLILNNGLTVAGTAAISGKLTANATNGAIQIGGSGYSLNPSGMMIGQYIANMGYIQAPSGGRVEIWNGGTENVATFFNDKSTSFYGSITASGGIHTAKYTRVNDLYEYVTNGPYNPSSQSIQVFRQFHDAVNWCTGGQLIEITCHGYAHGEFDHAIYFVRYGYGGNSASVDTRLSPITNRITAPYWGTATNISGNDYYRDLMFDTQSYRTYKIVIKTIQPLTSSATPGTGFGNYVWVFGY